MRWLVGGWQLNGIISLYSGQAFTPYLHQDYSDTGSAGMRPDRVGNPSDFSNAGAGFNGGTIDVVGPTACLTSTRQNINCWYNPAAFAIPAPYPNQSPNRPDGIDPALMFGNAGRGSLRGPAFHDVDFSVFKSFKFQENKQVQLRAEIFNLFNTPQFALPNNVVDTSNAGQITSTLHESRQIQVSVNISF